MNCSLQESQVSDITSQWELAQRMSGHAKAPEQSLKLFFKGVMQELEKGANRPFEASMKERVWSAVSKDRLKTLQETLTLEFCDKILGGFSEGEVRVMLEEHKRTGFVKTIIFSPRLQTAFTLEQASIIETLIKETKSMKDALIPEIVEAVKKEGIELSESKKTAK